MPLPLPVPFYFIVSNAQLIWVCQRYNRNCECSFCLWITLRLCSAQYAADYDDDDDRVALFLRNLFDKFRLTTSTMTMKQTKKSFIPSAAFSKWKLLANCFKRILQLKLTFCESVKCHLHLIIRMAPMENTWDAIESQIKLAPLENGYKCTCICSLLSSFHFICVSVCVQCAMCNVDANRLKMNWHRNAMVRCVWLFIFDCKLPQEGTSTNSQRYWTVVSMIVFGYNNQQLVT